jgi:crotonobetainyl-CoA:carnitine CoA-transferase CaiB-like acyl-CoA transferase
LKICEEAGVPAGPINTIEQVFSDAQVLGREMIIEATLANGEAIRMLASPLKVPTNPVRLRYAPPILGQHTEEILKKDLGYGKKAITDLRNEKVI